jgi:hypothetical protein
MGVLAAYRASQPIPVSAGVVMALVPPGLVAGGAALFAGGYAIPGAGLVAASLLAGVGWDNYLAYRARLMEQRETVTVAPAPDGFEARTWATDAEGVGVRIDFEYAGAEQVQALAGRVVEKRDYALTFAALRDLGGWPSYGRDARVEAFRRELCDRGFALVVARGKLQMTGAGKTFFRRVYAERLPYRAQVYPELA